jgi:hypothetical protein
MGKDVAPDWKDGKPGNSVVTLRELEGDKSNHL